MSCRYVTVISTTFFKTKICFTVSKRSNSNYLRVQSPFVLIQNLRKYNGKFRYLLANIIAETFFLMYSYKTLFITPNYSVYLNFIDKTITEGINVKWFVNLTVSLKTEKFGINCSRTLYTRQSFNNNKLLHISSFKDRIVQKAIYLVLLEIYENKLAYFHKFLYGFRPNKTRHLALHELKFSWQGMRWYLKFDLKKILCRTKKRSIIKLLKANIYDNTLFSLLNRLFSVKTFIKKAPFFTHSQNDFFSSSLLSLFLFQVYMSPLDSYVENLSKLYGMDYTWTKSYVVNKLKTLVKKNISWDRKSVV